MNFTGRTISKEEINKLRENLKSFICIEELISILKSNKIIGNEFSLDELEDESEMGVEMQWMTIEEQIAESTDFYPGIIAVKDNFFPIGKCLEGSGDPYFICNEDGSFKIYRIPHDSISEDELVKNDIELICDFYKLLKYKEM